MEYNGKLPKLEIKLNERGKESYEKGGVTSMEDYDFLIDGYEPPALTAVDVSFGMNDVPQATMKFAAGKVDVDAQTINAMKWMIEHREQ